MRTDLRARARSREGKRSWRPGGVSLSEPSIRRNRRRKKECWAGRTPGPEAGMPQRWKVVEAKVNRPDPGLAARPPRGPARGFRPRRFRRITLIGGWPAEQADCFPSQKARDCLGRGCPNDGSLGFDLSRRAESSDSMTRTSRWLAWNGGGCLAGGQESLSGRFPSGREVLGPTSARMTDVALLTRISAS